MASSSCRSGASVTCCSSRSSARSVRAFDAGRAVPAVMGGKFEPLAQQPGRQRRYWVDAQHRRGWPADHFIGDADETLLLAAEKQPEQRQLPQKIVGTVERNQCPAQVDVVMGVI